MKGNNLSSISIQEDQYWTTIPRSASVVAKMMLKNWKDFRKVQNAIIQRHGLVRLNLGLSGHSLTVYKHTQYIGINLLFIIISNEVLS